MDDAVSRLAREIADAIAAAVASDVRVARCRSRAHSEGYDIRVSLEAVIGFSPAAPAEASPTGATAPRHAFEINAHDRRFLRSLRIAADETREQVD